MRKDFAFTMFVCMFLLSIATGCVDASPQATVYVYPEISEVKVGETFTVDINIRDVSGLQGLDFRLTYDTCLLDGLSVVEGPFMASGGSTFAIKMEVKDEATQESGRVWFAMVIYGEGWADGDGTLATITFKATAPGETVLDLSSEICTCAPDEIPHTDLDGYVVVSANPSNPHNSPDPPERALVGDINSDGIVDIFDVVTVSTAFGSMPGDPDWNQAADLSDGTPAPGPDGIVDIFDVVLVVQNFGQG